MNFIQNNWKISFWATLWGS